MQKLALPPKLGKVLHMSLEKGHKFKQNKDLFISIRLAKTPPKRVK
jgi:hypothetical protein